MKNEEDTLNISPQFESEEVPIFEMMSYFQTIWDGYVRTMKAEESGSD